jgi:hypothetical protein
VETDNWFSGAEIGVQLRAMYSVAQASVGVDAHRLPYCSSRTCRAKSQENLLDVRFRVAPQRHLPVESVSGRRNLHPGYRIGDSFGRIPKSSVCRSQDFATASGRRFSLRLRAQAPGEVAETVLREASQEESDDVLALGYGWKVREASRFDVEELRPVAHVQASSFHIEAAVFDELFFKLFKVRSANFQAPQSLTLVALKFALESSCRSEIGS